MVVRVPVSPDLLNWAVERVGWTDEELRDKAPKFPQWVAGNALPTFKQLEEFAHKTHAPVGYLFLPEPPEEQIPIPDFRTVGNTGVRRASPDLIDTIHAAQMRQDWYRKFAMSRDYERLDFVGSVTIDHSVVTVAQSIRDALDFDLNSRETFTNYEGALRQLIDSIQDLGVLVMVSGIVGNNAHRALNPDEFRGFAITDDFAPLIFVNGADTKAAQIFTMIHELAHIYLGESAISDALMAGDVTHDHELWCNKVAAEVLVPLVSLRTTYRNDASLDELKRLARVYGVSTLVILKRIYDTGYLTWDAYRDRYDAELDRVRRVMRESKAKGGDFYLTQPIRLGRHFMRAVIIDTLEGRTLHREAYGLLGTAKHETFTRMASRLGVA
ncbi:MAG: DNA-binding protein [Candidatus Lumbricidophila eiseniae]|uniref:DNA-binding protein n=1 Tax=Candidatus Lumbricidiphila eiseniae TaxID=1969409 RepID=A0A2A6FNB5_9MICO|nr:MAG: DNA-binding protein [Candidatus Lumbricidophila eiseniae]